MHACCAAITIIEADFSQPASVLLKDLGRWGGFEPRTLGVPGLNATTINHPLTFSSKLLPNLIKCTVLLEPLLSGHWYGWHNALLLCHLHCAASAQILTIAYIKGNALPEPTKADH
jgi:hypothetical protein